MASLRSFSVFSVSILSNLDRTKVPGIVTVTCTYAELSADNGEKLAALLELGIGVVVFQYGPTDVSL
jgi:hypothetical protein